MGSGELLEVLVCVEIVDTLLAEVFTVVIRDRGDESADLVGGAVREPGDKGCGLRLRSVDEDVLLLAVVFRVLGVGPVEEHQKRTVSHDEEDGEEEVREDEIHMHQAPEPHAYEYDADDGCLDEYCDEKVEHVQQAHVADGGPVFLRDECSQKGGTECQGAILEDEEPGEAHPGKVLGPDGNNGGCHSTEQCIQQEYYPAVHIVRQVFVKYAVPHLPSI